MEENTGIIEKKKVLNLFQYAWVPLTYLRWLVYLMKKREILPIVMVGCLVPLANALCLLAYLRICLTPSVPTEGFIKILTKNCVGSLLCLLLL